MDPDTALNDAREAFDRWLNAEQDGDAIASHTAAADVAEAFGALDSWMTNGGFLPAAWTRYRTSADISQPGIRLEGARVGCSNTLAEHTFAPAKGDPGCCVVCGRYDSEHADMGDYESDGVNPTTGPGQCKYCLRHGGLGLEGTDEGMDTTLVDPQWDGDGDVCVDCFEERQEPADYTDHDDKWAPCPGCRSDQVVYERGEPVFCPDCSWEATSV